MRPTFILFIMKKLYLLLFAASLSTSIMAQEKFELGKPNNDNYRYLDEYKALKEYIDHDKYPNFKLGIAIENLDNVLVRNMISKNASETVAGNTMKMASCVDGNGNMNFNNVKKFITAANNAGVSVYGHTLAWHSQQPKGWLLKLLADKPDTSAEEEWTVLATKNFCTDKNVGWKASEADNDYSISFSSTDGLVVTTTAQHPWEIQFVAMENIPLTAGKPFKMTMTVKGTDAGQVDGHLGDWGTNNDGDNQTGASVTVPFTTEWQDVEVNVTPTINTNFLLLHIPNFVGKVYIKQIKFEGNRAPIVPQTAQEMHDTLVYAMDKWIKGMMEACNGKVKAWDLVNEAIGGGGNDGQGNYTLQHSKQYNPDGNPDATWDVGGDAFYWQDYMGDLEYVRQACRLARKYGPEDIKLFINDYNLESDWDNNHKVKSLVNWIKKWEADGVTHIDGIGTQMHISCFENTNILNSIKKHITNMFQIMANSGKLVRVSEMDMGYVRGSDRWGSSIKTSQVTEAEHKKMADFYEWIIKEYFRIVPPEQQWGICQWCATDSPNNSGWRGGEPVGIWDSNYYRKHVYAGFVRGLNGGEPATGIDKVDANKSIDTSKGIYNLNGMLMSTTSLDELPSGLYIVNGKKVVK